MDGAGGAAAAGSDGAGATALDRPAVRYVVVALVVAGLIAVGLALELGTSANKQNIYLLLGIPVTALFQVFISRRPLRALWVRDAPPFRPDAAGVVIALLLAITPVVLLVRDIRNREAVLVVYDLAAIGGAVAAAYAIRAMRRSTLWQLGWCLATAGVLGVLFILITQVGLDIKSHVYWPLHRTDVEPAIRWFLLYLPALFVIEEVFFRGALDSYMRRPGEGTGWLSALFVSGLWGWWHIPLAFPEYGPRSVLVVLPMQVLVGVPLSLWWRRSGNLVVTGVPHALIDAVRNVLSGLP